MKNLGVIIFFIFIFLGFAGLQGCKEPENYGFLPFEEDVEFETSRPVREVADIDTLSIPEQPNSEVKWTSPREAPRSEMDPMLNKFIRENIFWAGRTSVLIVNRQKTILRYIWIDPVDVRADMRYGADIVCVSNSHPRYFSPRDIEKVDDGYTTLVMPEMIDYTYSLTESEIFVKPYAHFYLKDTKIATTPAAVKGMTGQETWNNNVGYIFWLGDYCIWYTGALSADIIGKEFTQETGNAELSEEDALHLIPGSIRNDLFRIHDVDIMIVPISTPAKVTAEFIIELAKHVNAKAIYIVGYDALKADALETFRKTIYKDSPVPFWYPEKFKTKKENVQEPKPEVPTPVK